MKILLVTMGMDIGGAETHILELAKELKRRGNEVFVASNGGKYVDELRKSNIEHIFAPMNNKKIKNLITSYKTLKKVIKEKNIDIVHSHSRITSFICGILQKEMNFPFITTAHGTFKVTTLFKLTTNWGENVLAVSEDIKDYLIKNYNINEENIFLTVNGIDTEKFNKDVDYSSIEKEFGLLHNSNRIVNISRLDEASSLATRGLLNIAEKLNDKIENLEIVITGGGDIFEELNKKATEINEKVGKKLITMTGSRTDINKFAVCGTIFVGVSRAALEAMSCEKPIVLAGAQGYLGIFDESKLEKGIKTNFCCRGLEETSEEAMLIDILDLMKSNQKEEYGRYNREIVKKYYSISKMTDDVEKVYKKTYVKYK